LEASLYGFDSNLFKKVKTIKVYEIALVHGLYSYVYKNIKIFKYWSFLYG
jgi:hypothetical protein